MKINLLYILLLYFSFFAKAQTQSRILGNKSYEVSNHLGNVMAAVSDRKTTTPEPANTKIDFNETDIKAYSDYYPYGMLLDNRNGSNGYRFGFQGQEKDDKVKGNYNSINYKYRVHDPRLGRFFAVDPLSSKYPHNSTYAFSENNVIDAIELEGLEKFIIIKYKYKGLILKVDIIRLNEHIRINQEKYVYKTVQIKSASDLNYGSNVFNRLDIYKNVTDRQKKIVKAELSKGRISKTNDLEKTFNSIERNINLSHKYSDFVNTINELDTKNNTKKRTLVWETFSTVHFNADQTTYVPENQDQSTLSYLDRVIDAANTFNDLGIDYTINVQGFASKIATNRAGGNFQLSYDRAIEMVDYLISKGVSCDKITWQANSDSDGRGANDPNAQQDQKTRVEFKIGNQR